MNNSFNALSRPEFKTDLLLMFANDVVLLMDEDGNLLEANEAAERTYGWPLEQLLKRNIRDLRDPSTLGDVPAQLKLAAQDGALFETRHLRRDGSTFPVEVSSRLFVHNGCNYRHSIVRDITRRHALQVKLERDARRFEGLLRLNEMATCLPEKEFLQFGLELVEKLTASKIAFFHFVNEDQETIELTAWSVASREKFCTAAYEDHYPVSRAGIWADSLRQHQPVIFNDYAHYPDKHGLPEGHSVLERLISVPVAEGDLVRGILGVGNKESDYNSEDVEIALLFGNDMWRIIRHQRVEAELLANLEYQRGLNKKLEDSQSQLLQSERMASIGLLAAGVAHELNNPLGFVSANLNTMEKYVNNILAVNAAYESAEKTAGATGMEFDAVRELRREADYDYISKDIGQLVTECKDGVSRMSKIVQELMAFAHAGEEGWRWFDLNRCIDSTLTMLRSKLHVSCNVHREHATLPEVFCVPMQINLVLMNILNNAIQAIETAGSITIRTGLANEEVWIQVADTGRGISPKDQKRIFDPFFSTKPVGSGVGLGLFVAYSIVQKHRGHIEVSSEVNKGTTMRVRLPLAPP